MTAFVSRQVRRTAPAHSLAGPAQRVGRSFASVGRALAGSYRAYDAASVERRDQGVDVVAMLMHARS